MKHIALIWHRSDLRISDHAPLQAAVREGYHVIPFYIYSEDEMAWPIGSASRWWLHHSLIALSESYKEKGSNLILLKGDLLKELKKLVKQTGAVKLFYHQSVEPFFRQIEDEISFIEKEGFFDQVLYPPGSVLNGSGEPYQVFTPFYKQCLKIGVPRAPIATPSHLPSIHCDVHSLKIEELSLLPKLNWDKEFYSYWTPGEKGAKAKLNDFLSHVKEYSVQRDFPFEEGTSRLSPHLHFGEISPQQIYKTVSKHAGNEGEPYLRQLIWREFAHHMLYFHPQSDTSPLKEEFKNFPWKNDSALFHAWKKGATGYPIVDAGMRQLWRLGWMHNRLRMIVGSFLVKDLLIPWQEGEKWFWDTLVDADLPNNAFGWQWIAGCGADAAPYFRIFNPILQGKKFDPEGEYIKEFVPELAKLPSQWIHTPWLAPSSVLMQAGIKLGVNYPNPIVDHDQARKLALEYYFSKKGKNEDH